MLKCFELAIVFIGLFIGGSLGMMEEFPICGFHLVPHFQECSSGVKYQHFCFLANFRTPGGPQRERERVCVCVCWANLTNILIPQN
jgi:hypothetical protein